MADEQFYMQQALQEARKAAEAGEVPVGAVVVVVTVSLPGHTT